jgi:hypothetical protein
MSFITSRRTAAGIAFLVLAAITFYFGLDWYVQTTKAVFYIGFIASAGVGLFLVASPILSEEGPDLLGEGMHKQLFPFCLRNVLFVCPLFCCVLMGGAVLFSVNVGAKIIQSQLDSVKQDIEAVKLNVVEDAKEALKAAEDQFACAQECYDRADFANCRRHLECTIINIASARNGGGVSIEEIKRLGL